MTSMLVPSNPWTGNSFLAASRMAARFSRSLGRPGPADALAAGAFISNKYWTVQFDIHTIPARTVTLAQRPGRIPVMRAISSPMLPILRFAALIPVICLATACARAPEPPAPERPAVVVQPVAASDHATTYFSGEVRARHESPLAFRVSGKIEKRLVDVGAHVAAGDVLATLDPSDLRLQLGAAEAAVA